MTILTLVSYQVMTMNTPAGPAMATNGRRSAATTGHRQEGLPRRPPTIPIGVNE